MVLESTVVCVDNSEYMRNGDFVPSRLHAQQDAVNLVCQSKTRSNPENNVGLITLSDDTEVLVTLTTDVGRVLSKLHQTSPKGNINFLCGIKVAHLVLKHRQGKNHKMRIVAFVASPILDQEKELVKYGKRLRKEKVNVDIVNFGEEQSNTEKLTNFINAINGTDAVSASHLVTVPPGPLLSDTLMTSPILVGEDGQVVVGAGNSGFEFGIDPNEDPELALALRVSMEEQRAEQEARRFQNRSPPPAAQQETSEEAMLKQALEMSMQTDDAGPSGTQPPKTPAAAPPPKDFAAMTEEEQMAYALQMSMEVQETQSSPQQVEKMEEDDVTEAINDPEFLRNVLQGLPGVDADSEAVKKAMDELKKKKEDEGKK